MAAFKSRTGDPNLDQSNVSLNETIESSRSVNTSSLLSNLDIKCREVAEGSPGKATTNITKVKKNNPPVIPLGEGSSLKGNVHQSSNLVQTPHNITASPSQLSNANMLLQMGQMLVAFGGMAGTQGSMHATNPLFQASQLLPPNPQLQNQWNPLYATPYLPQGYVPRFEAPPPGISPGGTSYFANTVPNTTYFANTVQDNTQKEYVFICPENLVTTPINTQRGQQVIGVLEPTAQSTPTPEARRKATSHDKRTAPQAGVGTEALLATPRLLHNTLLLGQRRRTYDRGEGPFAYDQPTYSQEPKHCTGQKH